MPQTKILNTNSMKILTQAEAYYMANRAHNNKELKFLLTPYISTRLFVYFNHRDPAKRKKTFYANEHRVTYSQCIKQLVPNIILNKQAGFNALVGMVESLKGKYISARIYMREPGKQSFDIVCREWYRGDLILKNDPPFEAEECQVLYYTIENGRVTVHEKEPEKIDFKKEIENNLK
jgi:hypothetical protein